MVSKLARWAVVDGNVALAIRTHVFREFGAGNQNSLLVGQHQNVQPTARRTRSVPHDNRSATETRPLGGAWRRACVQGTNAPAHVPVSALVRLALLFVVAATAGAGCRREIGDECTTAVDCNPNGSRSCDATQPGGYCTIQGLRRDVLPGRGGLHALFPGAVPDRARATPAPGVADTGCMADEICLDEGLCARQSTELRYCVKSCASGDDCRAGYECRLAGTRGSMALTSNPDAIVHFCAPRT